MPAHFDQGRPCARPTSTCRGRRPGRPVTVRRTVPGGCSTMPYVIQLADKPDHAKLRAEVRAVHLTISMPTRTSSRLVLRPCGLARMKLSTPAPCSDDGSAFADRSCQP